MKSDIQYLRLWRKKRNELRVEADADKDWIEMQDLLNKHMPVNDEKRGGKSKKGGISFISLTLITLSAAAMVYVTAKVTLNKNHKDQTKINKLHHRRFTDRMHNGDTDSLVLTDNLNKEEKDKANTAILSEDSVNIEKRSMGIPNKNKNINEPGNQDSSKIRSLLDSALNNVKAVAKTSKGNKIQGNVSSITHNTILPQRNQGKPIITSVSMARINNSKRSKNDYFSKGTTTSNEDQLSEFETATPYLSAQSIGISSGTLHIYPIVNDKLQLPKTTTQQARLFKNNAAKGLWEWGVLTGVNSSGSFTSKNLNANYYGKLPFDFFAGLYINYFFNRNWGIGTQISGLNPTIANGGLYKRPYLFYTDSITTVRYRNISDSKKVYSLQIPVYTTYQINDFLGVKAGPVISLPVKQINITQIDSVSSPIVTHAVYDKKTDLGFSAGLSYRYKMFLIEAYYLKGLTHHSITSDSLIYRSTNNTLQFSLKIQLGGRKK